MSKERVAMNGIRNNNFPCTAPGGEWFPSIQNWWVLQGDLQKKPQGNFLGGIAGGNAQTPTAGLLRCPDPMGYIPKVGYGVNHQVLESRGALGLVQTYMMAATSQGARAPCEVGLGGPDMGSPAWWVACPPTSTYLQRNSPHWSYSGASVIQRLVCPPFCFGDLRHKIVIYTEHSALLFIGKKKKAKELILIRIIIQSEHNHFPQGKDSILLYFVQSLV